MAEPTVKSPILEGFFDTLTHRSASIRGDVCVPPPFGCGGPAVDFRNEISRKEYSISGLCQKCQDEIFGVD